MIKIKNFDSCFFALLLIEYINIASINLLKNQNQFLKLFFGQGLRINSFTNKMSMNFFNMRIYIIENHRIAIFALRNNHFVFDTVWKLSISAHKTTIKLNYLFSCHLEFFPTGIHLLKNHLIALSQFGLLYVRNL